MERRLILHGDFMRILGRHRLDVARRDGEPPSELAVDQRTLLTCAYDLDEVMLEAYEISYKAEV